jgi:hypothetical protein
VEVTQVFEVANERIAERARVLGFSDAIPFLCECDDSTCFAIVRLAAREYAERRAAAKPITIPEHSCEHYVGARRRGGDVLGGRRGRP